MDVLADIVASLELESSLYFRAELSAPFAVRVPEERRRIRFHVAGSGRCWVQVASGESAWLAEGDLVLVPHGAAHVLADVPCEDARALCDVLDEAPRPVGWPLRYGGGGALSELVCGHFAFDERIVHPVIDGLPPLLHLPAGPGSGNGPGFAWMTSLLECIENERTEGRPGRHAVALRLSEILFIQVLRARLEAAPGEGALAALGDPQLRRALGAVHAQPAADWSLARLASEAGLSRTLLSERFRERLGMSPMRYVSEWRMQRARRLLADASLSVGEVGRQVGYASEAAFSRAFCQSVGEAPGRYRRACAGS